MRLPPSLTASIRPLGPSGRKEKIQQVIFGSPLEHPNMYINKWNKLEKKKFSLRSMRKPVGGPATVCPRTHSPPCLQEWVDPFHFKGSCCMGTFILSHGVCGLSLCPWWAQPWFISISFCSPSLFSRYLNMTLGGGLRKQQARVVGKLWENVLQPSERTGTCSSCRRATGLPSGSWEPRSSS